jgi:hypothetical protein
MARKKILSTDEAKVLDSFPILDASQRHYWFNSVGKSPEFKKLSKKMAKYNKANFLVTLVYFLIRKKFFFKRSTKDLKYALKTIGVSPIVAPAYSRTSLSRHKKLILISENYKPYDNKVIKKVSTFIVRHLKSQQKAKDIFFEVLLYLNKNNFETPNSHAIEELIRCETIKFDKSLEEVFLNISSKSFLKLCEIFFANSTNKDSRQRYLLHSLKSFSQSMKTRKIKENADALSLLRNAYNDCLSLIQKTNLDEKGVAQLAYHFKKSDHYQFKRMDLERRYLYLCCFITLQYKKLQDHMIQTLFELVKGTETKTKNEHKDFIYGLKKDKRNLSEKAYHQHISLTKKINELEKILYDEELNNSDKIDYSKIILNKVKNSSEKVNSRILSLQASYIEQDDMFLTSLEANSKKINNKINCFLHLLDFNFRNKSCSLRKAIESYKKRNGEVTINPSLAFLTAKDRDHIKLENQILKNYETYRFFLFSYLVEGIRSGEIGFYHSFEFLLFDDYLIPEKVWKKDRTELIEFHGLKKFANGSKVLSGLGKEVHRRFHSLNDRLNEGTVKNLKVLDSGRIVISTPGVKKNKIRTPEEYFPLDEFISLPELMKTVNSEVNFLSKIEHHATKFVKSSPDQSSFMGAIFGLGCHIGHRKICRTSKGLEVREIEKIVKWYLSPENLAKANDLIVNYLNKAALPQIYKKKR